MHASSRNAFSSVNQCGIFTHTVKKINKKKSDTFLLKSDHKRSPEMQSRRMLVQVQTGLMMESKTERSCQTFSRHCIYFLRKKLFEGKAL